jgi:hypothetical protein
VPIRIVIAKVPGGGGSTVGEVDEPVDADTSVTVSVAVAVTVVVTA